MGKLLTVKQKGNIGEEAVVNYIERNTKMNVISRNYHSRYGEIDIICNNDDIIAFVEVKMRKKGSILKGLHSIDKRKVKKIIKTTYVYMQRNDVNLQPRFDVAQVTCDNNGRITGIDYISDAFDAQCCCTEDSYEAF